MKWTLHLDYQITDNTHRRIWMPHSPETLDYRVKDEITIELAKKLKEAAIIKHEDYERDGETMRRYTGEIVVMHMDQLNHIMSMLNILKLTASPAETNVIDAIRDELINK